MESVVSRKVKIEKYKSIFVNENTNNNANYDSDDLMYGATVLELLPRNSNNKHRLRANPALMKTGPYAQINKTDVSLFECSSESSSSTCDNSTIDEYKKIKAHKLTRPAAAARNPSYQHNVDRTGKVGVISRSNESYGVRPNPETPFIDEAEPPTKANLERDSYVKFFVDVVSNKGEDSIKVINIQYHPEDQNTHDNNSNNNNNSETTISSSTTQSSDTTTTTSNKINKNNNNYEDSDDSAESIQQKIMNKNKSIHSNCKDSDSDISKNKKIMKMDSETYKQFKMFLKQRQMYSVNNDLKKSHVQKLTANPTENNPNNTQSACIGDNNISIQLQPEVVLKHEKGRDTITYFHDKEVTETVRDPNWMNEPLVLRQTFPAKMVSKSESTYTKKSVYGYAATPTETPRNKQNLDYEKSNVSNLSAAVQTSNSQKKSDSDYRKMKASDLSAASGSAQTTSHKKPGFTIENPKNVGINAENNGETNKNKNTAKKTLPSPEANSMKSKDDDDENDDDDTISLDATLKLRIYEDENGNLVTDNKAKLISIDGDDDLGLSKKTSAVHLSVSTEAMGKRSQTELVVPLYGEQFSDEDEIRLHNRNFTKGERHAWFRDTNTNENNNVMIETEKKAILKGMVDKNYYYMEKCEKTSVLYSTDSSATSVSSCSNSQEYRAKNEESDIQSMSTSSSVTLVASSNDIVASRNYEKTCKNKSKESGNVKRLVAKHQQAITTEDSTTTIDDERNIKHRSKSKLSALKRFAEKNGKKLLGKKELTAKDAATNTTCAKHDEVSDSRSEDVIEGYEKWQLEEMQREDERQRLRKSQQLKEKRKSKQ